MWNKCEQTMLNYFRVESMFHEFRKESKILDRIRGIIEVVCKILERIKTYGVGAGKRRGLPHLPYPNCHILAR